MRRKKLMTGGAIAALVALVALVVWQRARAATPKQAAAVQTAAVARGSLDVTAEASGTIQPLLVIEVKSRASGEITSLAAETGDHVRKGTVLAQVDPRDVANALAQARADLAAAQVQVQTTGAQEQRSRELKDEQIITADEYEGAAMAAANAHASLVKAQTNLQLAEQKMGDVTIEAPITGTVIEKDVEAGQIIASASQTVSGGTTLFKMANLDTMQVNALVDETDIGRVQPGQTARVTVEAYPGRTFVGRVRKIEPQAVVDQNVTMFPVLIDLDNRAGLLKPGMNADVQVQIARRDDALLVPNDAVVGMKDAASVGSALGLSAEQVRTALHAGRPGASAAGASAAAVANPACAALLQKVAPDGGWQSLSDADRTQLRACRGASAGGAGAAAGGTHGQAGAHAQGGAASGTSRPGVVFVSTPQGPTARRVMLGINDYDNTEVVSGLQAGDRVVLASALRLKQQQDDMQNRMRERAGGMLGGATGGSTGSRGGRGGAS